MKYISSGLTSAHFFAYWAPSEPLPNQVEWCFTIWMTALSGVTHFDMDWGSACQNLLERGATTNWPLQMPTHPPSFAHPIIPTYLTKCLKLNTSAPKLVIHDLWYRLKRGHPFFHGLGVSMPIPFRKGIACHPTTHMCPFCYHGICCFIIWYDFLFHWTAPFRGTGTFHHFFT